MPLARPTVTVDLRKITENTRRIVDRLSGVDVVGVTKVTCGAPEVGRAMLEKLGYRVVVSREGQDAVQVITDRGAEIDLVILDMIMPGMDGGKTFDRIREVQPGVPVLLSSGYAINGQALEIMQRGCNGFIQKPYNISELSNKVRNVLDERTS